MKCIHTFLLIAVANVLLPFCVLSQTRDSLKEVKVSAKPVVSNDIKAATFSPGQKLTVIDSTTLKTYQGQNVANLLSQQLPVFIKSYSFNGLSTLSFRGSSSAQSQVLWNGIPIQNAALGIADISTLPVTMIAGVSVLYGGSSAMYGSGNVGGALLLENEKPKFDSGGRGLSLAGGLGSFHQYSGSFDAHASGTKWYLSLKGLLQTATNDFPFTDDTGTSHTTTNGALKSKALMLYVARKTGLNSVLSMSGWLQQYYREIPPANFEFSSQKVQLDRSLRLLIDWTQQTEKNTFYAKTSLFSDKIQYDDPPIGLHSSSPCMQSYSEIGWRAKERAYGQWLLFAPIQLSWMKEPVSGTSKQQTRVALAGAYNKKFFSGKLNAAVNARTEMIDSHRIFLPGADASFAVTNWFSLRANVQRSYRTPTLNELYYDPGGNPYLKPEQGWSEDAGYNLRLTAGRFSFYQDAAIFNRAIQDWILWLGGAIFTPHNIAKVHSRGTETETKITYKIKDCQFHAGVGTAYVIATTVESYLPRDNSIGKQIPYTPRYSGRLNIGCAYKGFYLNYNHSYTGYRFTTYDESEFFLPYQLGNLQLMYTTKIYKHDLQITAQCNNIWNLHYQVISFRPMPGVNWMAGARVGIL